MGALVRHTPAVLLGAFLIFIGSQKFGAENVIFATIAEKSGFAFFEPYVRLAVGVGELVAGALLIAPFARHLGVVMAAGLIGGAILFHLSPWLGIVVAAAPGEEPTPALFVVALVFAGVTALVAFMERERLAALARPFAVLTPQRTHA
ncbi:MAG: hypothetical protein AAFR11_09545 [Pseudomonadota bacterium]